MTRLGTAMVRLAHKDMADSRALEEQAERAWGSQNPIQNVRGSGATPSMGLSQIRGGKKSVMKAHEADAMAQGHALAEHLHRLHGSGYAQSFHKGMAGGIGTGRYEGEGTGGMTGGMFNFNSLPSGVGQILNSATRPIRDSLVPALGQVASHLIPLVGKGTGGAKFSADTQDFSSHHMKGGFWLPLLTSVGLPLISKLLGSGHMDDKCKTAMEKLIKKHEEKYHGGKLKGGFWGALASVGIPLIAKMLGAGHCSQKGHDSMVKMFGQCEKKEATAMKKEMKGAGRAVGAGKMPKMMGCDSDSDDEMKGKGFLSDLGIPLVSDVAGMFGLGKGKKAKRVVGESDGRRKRAEVVRRVMAEKGMKMIEASKYVKEHGLYQK